MSTTNKLFRSPEMQVWDMRRWNSALDLGLGQDDFAQLPDPPSEPLDPGAAILLVPRLPDRFGKSGLERTVEECIRRMLQCPVIERGGRLARMPDLNCDAAHLKDIGGRMYKPGLGWVIIDLCSSTWKGRACSPYYRSLMECCAYRRVAGLEVFAALAAFPDWLTAMDGKDIPFVWAPGLLLMIDHLDHRTHPYTPAISYRAQEGAVIIGASLSSNADTRFYVPRLLSYEPVGQ